MKEKTENIAPVILFVYSRLDHTQQTIEALKKNVLAEKSELIIYSDAPAKSEHEIAVNAVRNYIKNISGFKTVSIVLAERNKGLAKSIVEGVTDQVNKHGKVIVLEDDIITSRYFLSFMNEALIRYEYEEKVMQISGFSFPINSYFSRSTYFLHLTSSWGWGTWQRAWSSLSMNTEKHVEEINMKGGDVLHRFNIEDSMGFSDHLIGNLEGRFNTWAVKWYASVFLNEGLCLYPKNTFVKNIGHDGSGENSLTNNQYLQQIPSEIPPRFKKIKIQENVLARKGVAVFLRKINGKPNKLEGMMQRVKDKILYEYRKYKGGK